jgi:hypothetical protein
LNVRVLPWLTGERFGLPQHRGKTIAAVQPRLSESGKPPPQGCRPHRRMRAALFLQIAMNL